MDALPLSRLMAPLAPSPARAVDIELAVVAVLLAANHQCSGDNALDFVTTRPVRIMSFGQAKAYPAREFGETGRHLSACCRRCSSVGSS